MLWAAAMAMMNLVLRMLQRCFQGSLAWIAPFVVNTSPSVHVSRGTGGGENAVIYQPSGGSDCSDLWEIVDDDRAQGSDVRFFTTALT